MTVEEECVARERKHESRMRSKRVLITKELEVDEISRNSAEITYAQI